MCELVSVLSMFPVSFEAFNSMSFFSQAYNAFIEKNGPEQVLPELNMTSKELFFIGYAQVSNTKILSRSCFSVLRLTTKAEHFYFAVFI